MQEIDIEALAKTFAFCVYIHRRPDGTPFYVGKGSIRRAYEFSPSRRTAWHVNIVKKYGRENIIVQVIPCLYEAESFELEKVHIMLARQQGHSLVNLTDGGEGVSGREVSPLQQAALAKGRMKGKKGRAGPFPELDAWRASEAGQAHTKRLSQIGAANLHKERTIACAECGVEHVTTSARSKCCSRLCEQRFRRAGKNK